MVHILPAYISRTSENATYLVQLLSTRLPSFRFTTIEMMPKSGRFSRPIPTHTNPRKPYAVIPHTSHVKLPPCLTVMWSLPLHPGGISFR